MKETEIKTQNKEQTKEQSKGAKVVKTILNTVINILIVLVLITSLLIAVMALTSKASGVSTIFGTTIQPIQSDSMKGGSPDGYEGGDFGKGDLMLAKATNSDSNADYQIGDIITFKSQDTDGTMMLIVHRIVDKIEKGGVTRYQTWGDNREVAQAPDQATEDEYITASDIASVYYNADYTGNILKGWGTPIDFLKTQQGFFLVVLLPMIIFFMYELVRVVLNATNYRKAKADEDKDAAVKEAVAAALAEKEGQNEPVQAEAAAPAGMSAEQMEQFKQFMAFQQMQQSQQEQNPPEETPNSES